jgi:hypothetical protein
MPADDRQRQLARQPDADPQRQALERCRRGLHDWRWGLADGRRECPSCGAHTTQSTLCKEGVHAWGPWRGGVEDAFLRSCCACDQPERLEATPCPTCQEAGQPPSPATACQRCEERSHDFGLVISGLGLQAKREAAVALVKVLGGLDEAHARDMCRSPVVPVLKRTTEDACRAALARFKAAGVNVRMTQRKKRR